MGIQVLDHPFQFLFGDVTGWDLLFDRGGRVEGERQLSEDRVSVFLEDVVVEFLVEVGSVGQLTHLLIDY